MRYQSFNFTDSFSNASGSRRESMALGELGKVINQHPSAVRSALREAGVNVSSNTNRRGLAKLIYKNKNNKKAIRNLSALVLLNAKYDEGYNFFGRNKNKDATSTTGTDASGEKKGFFKKVGQWFKDRKARKQQEKQNQTKSTTAGETTGSQIGSLLRENKESLMDIGGGLLGGLFSQGGGSTLQQQSVSPNNPNFNPNTAGGRPPMSMTTKVLIGVGILGAIGLTIFLVRRGKK